MPGPLDLPDGRNLRQQMIGQTYRPVERFLVARQVIVGEQTEHGVLAAPHVPVGQLGLRRVVADVSVGLLGGRAAIRLRPLFCATARDLCCNGRMRWLRESIYPRIRTATGWFPFAGASERPADRGLRCIRGPGYKRRSDRPDSRPYAFVPAKREFSVFSSRISGRPSIRR